MAAALGLGVAAAIPAEAAPSQDPSSAEEQARQKAMEPAPSAQIPEEPTAPELDTSRDQAAPLAESEFDKAWRKAKQAGEPVELASQTTETTISYVQPDGTVRVESSAGPVRTLVDGHWVAVDLTLAFTDEGVKPKAVSGDITFSDGGRGDPMAVLGDGDETSISLDWDGDLPKPVLRRNTATYRDVLPAVDLVLTATRLGFEQHVVVRERPTPATLEELESLRFPMDARGAEVDEGDGGELQVLDGAGAVIGTAAAPTMWDARTDHRTDEPVALRELGMDLLPANEPGTDGTLLLTPPADFLTAPSTVYPVTIDPTQALGALGDTFVQSNIANTAQGGSTEIRAGTYDGPTAARGYLKFDVTAAKNRVVQAATLSLFEFHSWSCSARPVDIRNVGNFDPNTLTWASQPALGSIVASANVALGYSSTCPDNWVNFNLTSNLQRFADTSITTATVMPLGVFADEDDVYGWKKFNSGNAGVNVPKLSFTYDGNCDQYRGNTVCGAIRTKWQALGGSASYLGLPTSDYTATPNKPGYYNHFSGGSIYWSSATGAHDVRNGAMRDRWAALGWENGYLGFSTSDMTAIPNGWYAHFQGGSMFWSAATGAKVVKAGPIRDKYQAMGWHTSLLGYPTTDEVAVAGGSYNHFQNGSIYYSAATGAHWIRGVIRDKWNGMGAQASLLGFPSSDETAVTGGAYNHFSGGSIFWSPETGAHWLRGAIRDKYAELGWDTSSLGFPAADEAVVTKTVETVTTAPDGTETITTEQVPTGGLHNEFSGGSIYWAVDSGAHQIQGAIEDHWAELGGTDSDVGYPISDEYAFGTRQRQDFTDGQILQDDDDAVPIACTITGTEGPDELVGTDGPDIICALDGDDVINALGGDDTIDAGDGNDVARGGAGIDELYGGLGDDSLDGGSDDDVLVGHDGDDLLEGDAGADDLAGEAGADQLSGGDDADLLSGGEGDDELDGGPGEDRLGGGAGDDRLLGGDDADALSGEVGVDTVTGGMGDDRISGDSGDDRLIGGDGADEIFGGVGSDDLAGGSGDDILDGGPSPNVVDGGGDPDSCVSSDENTVVSSCEALHVNNAVDNTASLVSALNASLEDSVVAPRPEGDDLVAMSDGGTVQIPVDPTGTVRVGAVDYSDDGLTTTAPDFAIGLPDLDPQTAGTVSNDGSVVYQDSRALVSITVQAVDDGSVQIATTIGSASAPTRYDYPFTLPEGGTLQLAQGGGVLIVDGEGFYAGEVLPAWAQDASGKSVPTHYELSGSTVTQVVDLSGPNIIYPVVADPRTWGACKSGQIGKRSPSDINKKVISFKRPGRTSRNTNTYLPSGTTWLLCGYHLWSYQTDSGEEVGMGYRHLVGRHHDQHFGNFASYDFCCNWRYAADGSMAAALKDPDSVTYNRKRETFCFSRGMSLRNKKNGAVIQFFVVKVIIRKSDGAVITSFPNTRDDWC